MKTHWFPLIRPAIRAIFLGGGWPWGGTLGPHEFICWRCRNSIKFHHSIYLPFLLEEFPTSSWVPSLPIIKKTRLNIHVPLVGRFLLSTDRFKSPTQHRSVHYMRLCEKKHVELKKELFRRSVMWWLSCGGPTFLFLKKCLIINHQPTSLMAR